MTKTKTLSVPQPLVRIGDSRERMISVATRLFLNGSYHGVGIAEICTSAEVNKGTFYHFFPSKTELLLEVMDRRIVEIEALIGNIHASEEPAARKILNLFTMFQRLPKPGAESHQIAPGHLLGNVILELASSSPGVREAARAGLDRWTRAMEQILAQFIKEERLHSLDAKDAAEVVLGLLQGATVLASVSNDPKKMAAFGHLAVILLRAAANPV